MSYETYRWRTCSARNDRCLVSGLFLAIALLLSATAAAQQEVAGAQDFPLIKRYEGSRLIGYDSRPFDAFKLLLGKLARGDDGRLVPEAVRQLAGRHTRLLYLAPPGR